MIIEPLKSLELITKGLCKCTYENFGDFFHLLTNIKQLRGLDIALLEVTPASTLQKVIPILRDIPRLDQLELHFGKKIDLLQQDGIKSLLPNTNITIKTSDN